MSIEQASVIDGIGVRPDGAVEMLISDHLEWYDEQHLQLLAAMVESYANAALSGELARSYPEAEGKQVCIKLVWQHVPKAPAARFFDALGAQLGSLGIGSRCLTDTNGSFPPRLCENALAVIVSRG